MVYIIDFLVTNQQKGRYVNNRKNHDIRNLLFVLSSAFFGAVLLASAFLYYYNPAGRYIAGQTLVDPKIIHTMNQQDKKSKSSQTIHFIFERIEFSYKDPINLQTYKQLIAPATYEQFYTWVSSEKNLTEVTEQIEKSFLTSLPMNLLISIRADEPLHADKEDANIFQLIEFSKDDYFRVRTQERDEQNGWVYFFRPEISNRVRLLFTQTADL